MPVADRVHRLGDRYVNWYVIEDGGRLTVLDAGFPVHWAQLPALLRAIGRSTADVDAVLLTHHHPDHVGNVERIRREAGARVLAHEADAPGVRRGGVNPPIGGVLRALHRPYLARYLAHIARAGGLRTPAVADVATFADGERVDVPGRPRVIHAPGHTPGSCALHLEARDVLFSGDAIVTLDTATGTVGPALLAPPFAGDRAQARASLERLEATRAATLLPGHGEPWRDGVAEAVRRARAG